MRRIKKGVFLLLSGVFISMIPMYGIAAENETSAYAVTSESDITVEIRKRAQWVDETNGDAKITLQYESNSGEISTIPDMDIIMIHDKSGSMDCNYGFNLAKTLNGWVEPEKTINYPILNSQNFSETVKHADASNTNDLESEGAENYKKRLNEPNAYTSALGAEAGYMLTSAGTAFWDNKMEHNSPCQLDQHYYLLIEESEFSDYSPWTMVNGKNLAGLEATDLHHYEILESREQALTYIEQGYRVLRVNSGYYVNGSGEKLPVSSSNPVYFLDISQLYRFDGKWVLNTCPEQSCQKNDRLVKSQEFMKDIAESVVRINSDNRISYIPFWGDVPKDGEWKNYRGTQDGMDVEDITDEEIFIHEYKGDKDGDGRDDTVSRVELTSDIGTVLQQISNPFTYNGTNWTKAFENVLEILEQRDAGENNRKTLILFLTDGMPHATNGKAEDYNNPKINGLAEIEQLKEISGVELWAIGVGVNNADTTGLALRLKNAATNDYPFYARTADEFEELAVIVKSAIEDAYIDEIYGTEGFYHDKLSAYFELDEEKIMKTDDYKNGKWKILNSVGVSTTNGVPVKVYNAVNGTGVKYVYVRNSKTLYWYIGDLSDGSYTDAGHEFVFPVKFLEYENHTGGTDQLFPSNDSQKLTYYTNKNLQKQLTRSMSSPQLIFHRTETSVLVTKIVSETKTYDRTYRFVCSPVLINKGTVTNIIGELELTIPANTTITSSVIHGLPAGIYNPTVYYVYEVDVNNRIINSEVKSVALKYTPRISTKSKSSSVPYSATASIGILNNMDNYLQLSTSTASAVFSSNSSLTIVKRIDCVEEAGFWEHGNPTFVISVKRLEENGNNETFYHTFEFTKDYVQQNQSNGQVTMAYTFTELPVGVYVVEELVVSRYRLEDVKVTYDGVVIASDSGSTVISDITGSANVYEQKAKVDLGNYPTGLEVEFFNKKVNYKKFSHVTSVKNIINIY